MAIEVNPEEDFHVVLNGNVVALSLDALSAAYESDVVEDESLIWQPGLGDWMRLDRVLYELEQAEPVAPAPPMAEDQYFVLVAPEQVRPMSLDLLAESYEAELVDESTLVWQTGFTEWIPLGFLLAENEPMQHVSIAPSLSPSAGYARPAPTVLESAQAWAAPSVAPMALSVPPEPAPASPWFKRGLLVAVVLAGLFVGHQFGVSHALASQADGASAGSPWSNRIGEPSPATPHGLERWIDRVETRYGLAELSATEPVPAKRAPAKSVEASDSSDESTSAADDSEESAERGTAATPSMDTAPLGGAHEEAATESGHATNLAKKGGAEESEQPTEVDAFGAALGTRPKPRPAPRAKPRAPRTAPSPTNLPTTGDPNDPMNGSL